MFTKDKSQFLTDGILIYGLIFRCMQYLPLNAKTWSTDFDIEISLGYKKDTAFLITKRSLPLLIISSAGIVFPLWIALVVFSVSTVVLASFLPFLLQDSQGSEDRINVNFTWRLLKRSVQHFGCTVDVSWRVTDEYPNSNVRQWVVT